MRRRAGPGRGGRAHVCIAAPSARALRGPARPPGCGFTRATQRISRCRSSPTEVLLDDYAARGPATCGTSTGWSSSSGYEPTGRRVMTPEAAPRHVVYTCADHSAATPDGWNDSRCRRRSPRPTGTAQAVCFGPAECRPGAARRRAGGETGGAPAAPCGRRGQPAPAADESGAPVSSTRFRWVTGHQVSFASSGA